MSATTNPLFNTQQFNTALFGGAGAPKGLIVQVGTGILYPALRKAGITLAPQRTPSPAQFQDAIDELNRLNGSLNADRLWIYAEDTQLLPIQQTKITYTIGQDPNYPVSDFDRPRPQLITQANYVYTQGPSPIRYPLALLTPQMWSRIRIQNLPATIPYGLYDDYAYPISTLYLYGQPPAGNDLEIWSWHRVPQFIAITDVVSLPDQYIDALVLNLAVRLVSLFPLNPTMPRQVDPNLYQQARESLMRLQSLNAPKPVLDVSLCGRGGFNVYSGEWQDNSWR